MSNQKQYAMIMAGGSGTRLWPMSKAEQPKQLIPFINKRSLLQIAVERLHGLVPSENILICAGDKHRGMIIESLDGFTDERYYGEPTGRDTLNAVGYVAACIAKREPEASIAVFTADHVIEPVDQFQKIVASGYALTEAHANMLVTFGISPTHAATGYGYLKLGDALNQSDDNRAYAVDAFQEKPDADVAKSYYEAGASSYLWNSGMFVWRAQTLMNAIKKFAPDNYAGLAKIADDPASIATVYPELKKVSIDYGVMEPASTDPDFRVAAVPMPLTWLDVGSWPSFADTCEKDDQGNAFGQGKHLLQDSTGTLVASSEPEHLIATIGCDDLIIIHTPHATLVCRKDRAEDIKKLHAAVGEKFGPSLL